MIEIRLSHRLPGRVRAGFLGLAALLTASCASSNRRPLGLKPAPLPEPDPRTELVLLNIPEASGWVAYRSADESADTVEDYRIVVIRLKTGELMYDSVIPLTPGLSTHGFEMAEDDPRLDTLARNVDRNIIAPLEAARQSLPSPVPEPAPTPEPEPETTPSPAAPTVAAAEAKPESGLNRGTVPPPDYTYAGEQEDGHRITLRQADSLKPGDRLFAREADRTIALPGQDGSILVSRGAVTGLVEVTGVTGTTATADLLSGSIPENAIFELSTPRNLPGDE